MFKRTQQKQLFKKFMKKFKYLKPLLIFIHYALYSNGLEDNSKGGLNIYGVLLLIVAYY